MRGPVEGGSSTGSFRIPGTFFFVALSSALFLSAWSKLDCSYLSIARGKEKVWRNTYPAFLSHSIGEKIVTGPYPAARKADYVIM